MEAVDPVKHKARGLRVFFCENLECQVLTFKGKNCPGCHDEGVIVNELHLRGVGVPTVHMESQGGE
jgi:hypothetical protein